MAVESFLPHVAVVVVVVAPGAVVPHPVALQVHLSHCHWIGTLCWQR